MRLKKKNLGSKATPRMSALPTEGGEGLMVPAAEFQVLQDKFDAARGEVIDLRLQMADTQRRSEKQESELRALRAAEPPKIDKKKVQNAVNAVLYGLLMDAKGALLASGDSSAAEIAIRITQMELNMPALALTETMLVQRAKSLSRKLSDGLEVGREEMDDFFKLAGKLQGDRV